MVGSKGHSSRVGILFLCFLHLLEFRVSCGFVGVPSSGFWCISFTGNIAIDPNVVLSLDDLFYG